MPPQVGVRQERHAAPLHTTSLPATTTVRVTAHRRRHGSGVSGASRSRPTGRRPMRSRAFAHPPGRVALGTASGNFAAQAASNLLAAKAPNRVIMPFLHRLAPAPLPQYGTVTLTTRRTTRLSRRPGPALGRRPGPRRGRVGSGRLVVGAARDMAPRATVGAGIPPRRDAAAVARPCRTLGGIAARVTQVGASRCRSTRRSWGQPRSWTC
jgi:hypothetical protein